MALAYVADITPADFNKLVKARMAEGKEASTLRHDVHTVRSMINRVRKTWNWTQLRPITEHDIEFPALPPGRDVVLKESQEKALAEALKTSYHPKAVAAVAFLVETAMRFTEAMHTACWKDVRWDECILNLRAAKGGAREVPLNEGAMAVLRGMRVGGPEEPIFGISYEALKAIFHRACERAGIENLGLHDLRHTGATRGAKRLNGNIFLLKLVTGHKTLSQLQRYVNLDAKDVVEAFEATQSNREMPALVRTLGESQAGDEKEKEKDPRRVAQPNWSGHAARGGAKVFSLGAARAFSTQAVPPASTPVEGSGLAPWKLGSWKLGTFVGR